MDRRPNKLEPSLPTYYSLSLPKQLRLSAPFGLVSSRKVKLALELMMYAAVQNVSALNEVLETLKAFSVMLYTSELVSALREREDSSIESPRCSLQDYGEDEALLLLDELLRNDQSLEPATYGDFSDPFADFIIGTCHGVLEKHCSSYSSVPKRASTKPDKGNMRDFPSIYAVRDFWVQSLEKSPAISEVETALSILYILLGEIDKAIEVLESKCESDLYDYYNLGTAYLIEKSDLEKDFLSMARKEFREAYDLNLTRYNVGMTYLREDDWEKATAHFTGILDRLQEFIHQVFVNEEMSFSEETSFIDLVIVQRTLNNLGIHFYYL